MKTFERRLRRLEDRFGPEVETEHDRWLMARLDAAARRRKELEESGILQPVERGPEFEGRRQSLREALGLRDW
jgi:hypothetical protein